MQITRSNFFLVLIIVLAFTLSAHSQENLPCTSDSIYQQMDFKLGTWEITSQVGHVFGIQSFEKILDGCAIKETYIATDGSRKGSSIIFYDPEDKLWKQTFADNQGDWTESTGKIVNGKLHFKGKSSRFPMIRWTIEMVSNDQLNWLTEISYDGHHWEILGNNTLNRTEEQR